MESTRAHSSGIILGLVLITAIGFFCGYFSVQLVKRQAHAYFSVAGNNIMAKRSWAIRKALKQGKAEYEFEVSGLHPILNK